MYSYKRDPHIKNIYEEIDNGKNLEEIEDLLNFLDKFDYFISEINKYDYIEQCMIEFSKSELKKELIEYVFEPKRMERMAKKYDIDIWDFIENY